MKRRSQAMANPVEAEAKMAELKGQRIKLEEQLDDVLAREKEIDKERREINEERREINEERRKKGAEVDKLTALLDAEDEEFEEHWANLSSHKKEDFDHNVSNYRKHLRDRRARLETELSNPELRAELAAKETRLAEKETQLAEKETRLRDEIRSLKSEIDGLEDGILESRKSQKLAETVRQVALKPLKAYKAKFDTSASIRNSVTWLLRFVETGEFSLVVNILDGLRSNFYQAKTSADGLLAFPVVDGAAGSGKSRLCWEVGQHFVKAENAQFVVVNCALTMTELVLKSTEWEQDLTNCFEVTAKALFERFTPDFAYDEYGFSLNETLERIKRDTGSKLVLIQVDEYSSNQTLARMITRACREIYRVGPNVGPGVLLLPVFSGVAYVNIRRELFVVSGKVRPYFISLSGVDDVAGLRRSFRAALGIGQDNDSIENLELVLASLGGFPRPMTWLLEALFSRHRDIGASILQHGNLSLNDARTLYNYVLQEQSVMYGFDRWAESLRVTVDSLRATVQGPSDTRRLSDRSAARTYGHLTRVHTLAVTGKAMNVDAAVWVGKSEDGTEDVGKSLRQLSATGLFTLNILPSDETNFDLGTVFVPMMAIDACCFATKIAEKGTLSPFSYSWSTMEFIAMQSLRCRWNSIWYANLERPASVDVAELRPGALFNPGSKIPNVVVDRELGPIVRLAESFRGDMDSSFKTGSDGNGGATSVIDRTVYMMTDNQAGNDGLALFSPVAIFNQTKSRDLLTENGTPVTQSYVNALVRAQQAAASKFDFGPGVTALVFDLFTNRPTGANLDVESLPENAFLTTIDNFEEVVGPVFATTKDLFVGRVGGGVPNTANVVDL